MENKMPVIKGTIRARLIRASNPRLPGWKRNTAGLWEHASVNHNAFVNAGAVFLLSGIQGGASPHANAGKTLSYIGVGTGFTAPTIADTALENELARNEIASWTNTGLASNPHVIVANTSFAADEAIGSLTEAALFNASTGAPMFARGLFGYGAITGATQADPCVLTVVAHGLTDGTLIYIGDVEGMTDLNGNTYYVQSLTDDTVALYSDAALTTSIDSSGYDAFVLASPNAATWHIVKVKTDEDVLAVSYELSMTLV